MGTEEILAERQQTHGSFVDFAKRCQELKEACHGAQWDLLPAPYKEAIEMILHKITRIVEGNADHIDHWADIQGYARLAEKFAETKQ